MNEQSELPLVGNTAPDFEAEAVFDQEFINVKTTSPHSSLVKCCLFLFICFKLKCVLVLSIFSQIWP